MDVNVPQNLPGSYQKTQARKGAWLCGINFFWESFWQAVGGFAKEYVLNFLQIFKENRAFGNW